MKLFSGAFVVMSTLVCASAHADDQTSVVVQSVPEQSSQTQAKPGLIATGIVLSAFGVGHIALGATAFQSAANCTTSSSYFCFKDMDNAIGGVSVAIGAALLLVGVPLIVYGSTAKRPRAQLGVSPSGLLFSGTF
jgi:hypothetical protein